MSTSMEKSQTGMRAMQIEMGMKQRQAMMASQMAMGKERFKYYSVFVGLAYIGLPIGAYKKKNPAMLIGLVPMSIGWSF